MRDHAHADIGDLEQCEQRDRRTAAETQVDDGLAPVQHDAVDAEPPISGLHQAPGEPKCGRQRRRAEGEDVDHGPVVRTGDGKRGARPSPVVSRRIVCGPAADQ